MTYFATRQLLYLFKDLEPSALRSMRKTHFLPTAFLLGKRETVIQVPAFSNFHLAIHCILPAGPVGVRWRFMKRLQVAAGFLYINCHLLIEINMESESAWLLSELK